MTKNYVYSVFRAILLSVLISQPIQAVGLFDENPIVVGSLIGAPLPLCATSCAAWYSMYEAFFDVLTVIFVGGSKLEKKKIFVPFIIAPIVTAVIAHAIINRTFSKSDSKKKAVHAAAVTNASMSLAPFLYAIATAPQSYMQTITELKYPLSSVGVGSLIGAVYMVYEYYKPVHATEHDKHNNKAG